MKIILFNGPPRSGKDTAVKVINNYIRKHTKLHPVHMKMSSPLKLAAHALFGLSLADENFFEDCKDSPQDALFGQTPRELYISLSEKFAKQIRKDFFVEIFIRNCRHLYESRKLSSVKDVIFICSDLGFNGEAERIIEAFGKGNVAIVKLTRPGTTFESDSREYVSAYTDMIANDTDVMDFSEEIIRWLHPWLERQYGKEY